jgi:hypothetical protein
VRSPAPLRLRRPSCCSPGATWHRSKFAKEIVSAGGSAEAAEVDAVEEQAIDEHLQSVIDQRRAEPSSPSPVRAARLHPSGLVPWCLRNVRAK